MIGTAAGIILGFLLATSFGCAFHLLIGGRAGRILLYIVASNIGFTVGHFLGQGLGLNLWKLGALHLASAAVGAVLSLAAARWLWPDLEELGLDQADEGNQPSA